MKLLAASWWLSSRKGKNVPSVSAVHGVEQAFPQACGKIRYLDGFSR
jgi:hypothetical protein